jgi:ribosomal protein S18 acetylase RimI-like enzyme
LIRPATPNDAPQVAALMILAMGHIAGIFAGSDRYEDAIPFFERFLRGTDNQYSYRNTLVFEENGTILGSVTGYDGARLTELRQPVLDEVRKKDPTFLPSDETTEGEFYLDCVNVMEGYQGKGIGRLLVQAFCAWGAFSGHQRVGLIVDMENNRAKDFYEKLGFSVFGEKDFIGHRYFHMIKQVR